MIFQSLMGLGKLRCDVFSGTTQGWTCLIHGCETKHKGEMGRGRSWLWYRNYETTKESILVYDKIARVFYKSCTIFKIIHDGLPFVHDVIIHPSTSFVDLNTFGIVYITRHEYKLSFF